MKILDNKGKLFGVINIIDLLILVIIVLTIVFGTKRLGGTVVDKSEAKEGVVTYEIREIRDVSVNAINVGDPIYHADKGTYIGEIVKKDVKPFTMPTDYRGEWIDAEVPDKFVVLIDVKANIAETDQYYSVGEEQTRIGDTYSLKNKNIKTTGVCVGIDLGK
jgi:formylmethanofuran dehydrogenase subunit A